MLKLFFAVSTSLIALSGCSIHPIQQDVTGIPTAVLVDHIRCEAVTAIEDKAIQLLSSYDRALADRLAADRSRFRKFDPSGLDKTERAFYERYINSAIAFNFTFDITEDNKATAGVDLLRPLTGGTFSLALGTSGEFSRGNVRRFTISDTFQELLDSKTLHCSEAPDRADYVYPISGTIGLGEVIGSFIDLNEGKDLQFLDKAEVFADTLTFVTTIGVSANPKVAYVTGGKAFQVMDAPFTTGSSRVDKHEVIVGLSLASFTKDNSRKTLSDGSASSLIAPETQILTSNKGTANQRAIKATTDQRINTYLDRAVP